MLKTALSRLFLAGIALVSFAASGADMVKPTVKTVAPADIAAWGFGLLIVLSIFLLFMWGIKRLSGFHNPSEKMRVVGSLSLGLREKIMLLQVGKKQLILAVTPGRIETLHVLEGDDCLLRDDAKSSVDETGFAQKLMYAMKTRPDE